MSTIKRRRVGLFFALAALALLFGGVVEARASDSSDISASTRDVLNALRSLYGRESGSSSSSSSSAAQAASSNVVTIEQRMQNIESAMIGPKVEEVDLSELFHENYRVYEERLNDDVMILTTVANGTVINRPVMLDVPKGVYTVLKRDGEEVSFESREPIRDQGSYVLSIYVLGEDQDEKPFSEQVIQRAKFRFRIQYEVGIEGVSAQVEGEEEESEEEDAAPSEFLFGEDTVSEDLMPEELQPDDFEYQEPEEETAEEIPPEIEEPVEEESVPVDTVDTGFLRANGMSLEYDPVTGFYKNTLLTNDVFYTNVPNGMVTNDPVMIQESDTLNFTVYKDGEVLENYEPGQYFQESGSYLVQPIKDDASYINIYNGNYPSFRFRIVTGPVSDLGVINAPYGTTIGNVTYGGATDPRAMINDGTVALERDGDYMVTMNMPSGQAEVYVPIDTTLPVFGVSVRPNVADIVYYTDDVTACTLYSRDAVVEDGHIINQVTKPGDYTLVAYDTAGNSWTSSFSVRYQVNAGAVIAILLVIGLIVALAVYILKIRKKVSIR